jgi:hypothetical protein
MRSVRFASAVCPIAVAVMMSMVGPALASTNGYLTLVGSATFRPDSPIASMTSASFRVGV